MTPFETREDFVTLLSALWDRILDTPAIVDSFAGTKLVARFRYSDFGADMYIDTTGERPRVYWDPEEEAPYDVEMILSSETCHRFWLEDLNVPLAIASRKIIAKGSVQKALKLIPALKPAFALYPQVLRERGRADLLDWQRKPAGKRQRRFFRARRPKQYDLDALPQFPMPPAQAPPTADATGRRTVERATDADLLRTMHTIRFFEEHLGDAFRRGDLPTEAIHLSIGQEAIAAGVCLQLRDTDYLNTTHRGHGHIIAKGADVNRMMAEIYGKAAGQCAGKGGSMHVTDRARGILGANGIVGAGYLLAMGAGWTIARGERDDISVVIAGDGSVNQGMFHEAANMIGVFELPVLLVVENNRYGEFTPIERHSAVTAIHQRAEAYRIESHRLDGNDARGLYEGVGQIIEAMRSDGKPRLVELMTYRWRGHMEGDPERYRSAEEKERFKHEDPIRRLERDMIARGDVARGEVEQIKEQASNQIEQAVVFAHDAAAPDRSSLLTHVYTPEEETRFRGGFDDPETKDGWRQVSVAQAVNEAIAEEMQRDDKVFLWGEDVTLGGYFNVTEGLVEQFGADRVIDTPISENAIVGGAVGAAMTGMRPIAEILFADFLTCCTDPIVNQAAKLRYMTGGQVTMPLTIRTPLGSGIGMAAQHSQSMERFFFGVPGLLVVAPADAYTAKGLLKAAIRSDNPVLFFEHKLLYATAGRVPNEDYTLPLGKARVVRAGDDVTIVTHLLGVSVALDAARLLEGFGIRAEVVDLATLYPMDTQTILESVAKTRRLVTVEEGHATGGIGAEVIARTALAGFHLLKAPPIRIAAPECPIPYAKDLENALLPSPDHIARQIKAAFG